MKFIGFSASMGLAVFAASVSASQIVDFEDNPLAPDSYYNGGPSTNSDGWYSGSVHFGNDYFADWGSWNGFAYSNVNNTTTPGFGNQYAAITGAGAGGEGNYAIAYRGTHTFFNLPSDYSAASVLVTNTTYAYLSMRDGDAFSKQFTVADQDYFELTFTGYSAADASGSVVGAVTVALADFRVLDEADSYILNEWTSVDLSPLGSSVSVGLSWASSDVGTWGINTPTYVAMDNLQIIPEPATAALLLGGGLVLLGWLRRRRG